jgi:HPt (histidine-containing phosphotransfer) domain-containing protein
MTPKRSQDAGDSVIHRPGSSWSQLDLGRAFDITTLSVIAELDPSGVNGVVEEVLAMFLDSLEPMLVKVERLRAAGAVSAIQFEAHKLRSAAGQIGALRLAEASAAIETHCLTKTAKAVMMDDTLDALLHALVSETIRVQRKLRRLLAR